MLFWLDVVTKRGLREHGRWVDAAQCLRCSLWCLQRCLRGVVVELGSLVHRVAHDVVLRVQEVGRNAVHRASPLCRQEASACVQRRRVLPRSHTRLVLGLQVRTVPRSNRHRRPLRTRGTRVLQLIVVRLVVVLLRCSGLVRMRRHLVVSLSFTRLAFCCRFGFLGGFLGLDAQSTKTAKKVRFTDTHVFV